MTTNVVILIAILAIFMVVMNLAGNALSKRGHVRHQPREVVPGDRFTLRSLGWSESELNKIFADFAKMYDVAKPRIVEGPSRIFSIDWPDGLEEAHILFAVNYLHYPRDFDLDNRSILVAARVRPGNLTGMPDDQSALVFVPENDTHFDRVHLVDDAGQGYLGDFGSTSFVPIDDARMPREVPKLFT